MSGLVSSLVSSLSLLTAASVSETTVVIGGCGSIVVGCCSIIGRYPPGSVDQCVCAGIPGARTSYARERVSTSRRAETLVLVSERADLWAMTWGQRRAHRSRRHHGLPRGAPRAEG